MGEAASKRNAGVENSSDLAEDTNSQQSCSSCEDALVARDYDKELLDAVERKGGLKLDSSVPGNNNNADKNILQHKLSYRDITPSHTNVEGYVSETCSVSTLDRMRQEILKGSTVPQNVPGMSEYKEGPILVDGKEKSQKDDCKTVMKHNVVRHSFGEELKISSAKGTRSEGEETNLTEVEQKIGKTGNKNEKECDPKENTGCFSSNVIEKRPETKLEIPKKPTNRKNKHETEKEKNGKQKLEQEKHLNGRKSVAKGTRSEGGERNLSEVEQKISKTDNKHEKHGDPKSKTTYFSSKITEKKPDTRTAICGDLLQDKVSLLSSGRHMNNAICITKNNEEEKLTSLTIVGACSSLSNGNNLPAMSRRTEEDRKSKTSDVFRFDRSRPHLMKANPVPGMAEMRHNVVRLSGTKVRQPIKSELNSKRPDTENSKSNHLNFSEDHIKRILDEELERMKRDKGETNLSEVEQKISKTGNKNEKECDPKENTGCFSSNVIEKRTETKLEIPKKPINRKNKHETEKMTMKMTEPNRADLIPDVKPMMEANSKKRVKQKSCNLNKFLEDIVHDEVCKWQYVKQSEPLPVRVMLRYNGRVNEPVIVALIESVTNIRFKLIHYELSDQKTSCILEFPSKTKSRKALQQLKVMRHLGLEYNFMEDMAAKQRQEKEERIDFVEQTGRKLIQKHEEKKKVINNQIMVIQHNKHGDLSIFSLLDNLERKITELQSQQTEFVRVMNSVLEEYDRLDVRMADGCYRSKVNKIEETFKLEVLKFSAALPMYAKRSEILKCIRSHQVSVILGETGSGKSTQITQYIADAGFSDHGQIICTQPRKVAAVTLAQRVAEEMATTVGGRVGYKVGTVEKRTKDTQIMYVTDHSLLNECITDPYLSCYSCIIIDEAHERSIYTDLLLGMVKKATEKRPDLRVVITSATIDPDVFVKYFQGCPVLKVSGRTFPVTVNYDNNEVESLEPPQNYVEMAVDKVLWIHEHEHHGDILVFLTSPKETEKAAELTKKRISSDELCCFELHGQQTPSDQQKVFRSARKGQRKVVFATNCAETSITIPGIKYVVDTGLSKEKHFDTVKNIVKLKVCYISKSSADQRKGRAGRVEPGLCYRLYSEKVYNEMSSVSTPEILRCHLGQSLLKLMLLGTTNPMEFDFIQAPPKDLFMMAWQNLEELGAVNSDGLTDLGQQLAQLSLEPRIGKLVIDGIENGIGTEVIIIAALAGVGYNIFYRGKTTKEQVMSEKNKVKFSEIKGDVLTALEIYKQWDKVPEKNKRAWCVENSLNGRWLRTARDDVRDLLKILDKELHKKVKYVLADSSIIYKTLPSIISTCFSSNICYYMGHKRIGYSPLSRASESFQIHPSSVVSCLQMAPQWIVFENILHTSQQFLINVTVLTEEEAMNEIRKRGLASILEKIRANMVSRCVVPGIGPTVKNQLIKKYGSIRRMVEEIRVEFSKVQLALDCDLDSLVLYAKRDEQKAILSFIQCDAEPIRNELKMTCHETEIIQNGGIRCVIQAGGTLKTILMPNDSRTVLIQNVQEGVSEDDIREYLSRFGKIENIIKYSKRNKTCWGKVIYMDHTSAITASTNAAKDLVGFFVSLSIPEKDAEQYQLRVSWCRRPLCGFGFAIFRNPYMAAATGQSRINVCGQMVNVQVNRRNDTELYFTGIPSDASFDEIKQSFLLENIEVDDLRLPRKKQFSTSSRELEMYKRQLKSQFDDTEIKNRYEIKLFPPKDKDYTINGYITCTRFEIAERLMEKDVFCQVHDHRSKVCMELQFHINEFISKEVYRVVGSDLLHVLNVINSDATPVRSENLQNGCFRFRVTVSNLEQLQIVRSYIDDVLKPKQEVISDQDQLQLVMSGRGTEILCQIMKRCSVYTQFDRRTSVLSIYGTTERRQAAFEAVKEFLKNTDRYRVRRISLAGEGKPPGMLKDLFRQYKVDLEKLRAECGLTNICVMMRNHKLEICGTNEALDKCDAILQNVTSRLSETQPLIQNEEQVRCPVCFCPVDENMYRMEYCTHVYCRECINGLVHHAIKSKELPIQCAQEDCTEVLVLQDLFNLLGKSDGTLKELCTAAMERFVSENKNRYSYCITPDCPVVYKTTRSKHLFQCPNPSCQVQICTYCKDKYHEGLSCAMYQGLKSDPDYDLKAWMKESPENRAFCPKCGYNIEKDGGCMHMHCIHCNAHFCWKCKQVFPTGQDVYDHQSTCPGRG